MAILLVLGVTLRLLQQGETNNHKQHKLLSDILRTSNVEINDVMRLIVERNVRPPWDDMPLPEGE